MQRRILAGILILVATGCARGSSDDATREGANGGGEIDRGWPGDPSGNTPGSAEQATTKPTTKSLAELGIVPFDVDRNDLAGPDSHEAMYGKLPEIVAVPGETFVDVAVRSTDTASGPKTVVVRLEPNAEGVWGITRRFEVKSLGNLLGFARSADGHYFYATGSNDPDVTKTFPAPKQHRSNVVRVVRFDADGHTSFDVDLDMARAAANADAEPIVSPGTASSARLAVAGNVVALVHGNATEPDGNGTRHQKALSTFLDAGTGAIRNVSSLWVSHSFDQRYVADGSDLYEVHLGDAYPRATVLTRVHDGASGPEQQVYRIKGATGDNNTFTRLGGLARIDAGPAAGGFLTLVATERTAATSSRINGSRDLGLVRLTSALANGSSASVVDPNFGTASTVESGGEQVTNRLHFLTDYHTSSPGKTHAERPKLVPIGGGEFIVLFEQWTISGTQQSFKGTFALRIDGNGAIQAAAKQVSQHHLPRGDDAFAYGGGAAWITGNETTRALTLHRVSRDLGITEHDVQ
ncbi:hypothetical protein LVJ94_47965 [Pendulispora rubella]|uniref:Uncharacterized protein n=1 Tax=Pendulispora rubella TaxID=2741070 RepID=A0ABZ2L3R0_9BACT